MDDDPYLWARQRGEMIEARRVALGWTQEDVVKRVPGLKLNTYGRIERGETPSPRWETLNGIAKVLGFELRQLLGPQNEEEPSSEIGRRLSVLERNYTQIMHTLDTIHSDLQKLLPPTGQTPSGK